MIEMRKPQPAKKVVDLRTRESKKDKAKATEDPSEDVLIHLKDDEIIAIYGSKDARDLTPRQYNVLKNTMLRALQKKDRPGPPAGRDVAGLDPKEFRREKARFIEGLKRSGK